MTPPQTPERHVEKTWHESAPDGTRTHTGAGLSRLPLPLGYGGQTGASLAPVGATCDIGSNRVMSGRWSLRSGLASRLGGIVAAHPIRIKCVRPRTLFSDLFSGFVCTMAQLPRLVL